MLIQSHNVLSIKYVACKTHLAIGSVHRPVLVSCKQDSGRAGPENNVFYKHKSRI